MHLAFVEFSEVGRPNLGLPLGVVRWAPVRWAFVAHIDGQRPVILSLPSQLRQTQQQSLIQREPCYWIAYPEQG